MRLRLILSFTLIVLISVTSVVLIARQGAAGAVRAFMFRGGMAELQDLVVSLEDYYQTNQSWEGAGVLLESVRTMHGAGMGQGVGQGLGGMMNQRLRLADASGTTIIDTTSADQGVHLSSREIASAIQLEANQVIVGYLLPDGGMNFTIENEKALINNITRSALIAGLISGGISLLLALFIAYGLLQPVRALTNAAGGMARGDLAQRVKVRGSDELALLGRAFNHMAKSLQQAEDSRRSMTADIAHELRNPLAVQRASLEALQDGIYPLTPDNLAPALEQNQLLTRLVDDLRTLALADSGQLRLEKTQTNLPDLVRRSLEHYRPQATHRRIEIGFTQFANVIRPLWLDPLRLDQILGNLLSNALRYTPDGGRIELTLSSTDQKVELQVHDSGPGIPPDAITYVFDRFYRADKSRTRSEGGSGLGLAIARQLARAHGGDLSAANHPQGGAIFTLKLPTTPSDPIIIE